MKSISSPSVKVPRLNSLLHRLQKNPGSDDESHLDQLMIFLVEPPPDQANRWKAGAEMCAAWGIATSETSVWRLYRSYLIEWRVRVTLKIDDDAVESAELLAQKASQMIALRMCELLGNPDTPTNTLLSLFRIDLRHKQLDLVRQKQRYQEQSAVSLALEELTRRTYCDPYAEFALKELRAALQSGPSAFRDPFNEAARRRKLKSMGLDPDKFTSPDSLVSSVSTPKPTPKAP